MSVFWRKYQLNHYRADFDDVLLRRYVQVHINFRKVIIKSCALPAAAGPGFSLQSCLPAGISATIPNASLRYI